MPGDLWKKTDFFLNEGTLGPRPDPKEQIMQFYLNTYPVVERDDLLWVSEEGRRRWLVLLGHSDEDGLFRADEVRRCQSLEETRKAVSGYDFNSAMVVTRKDFLAAPVLLFPIAATLLSGVRVH